MQTIATVAARVILGIIFFVFGLNGFLGFMPTPDMTPEGEAFIGALVETGYMLPFWKSFEVLCGLAFLLNLFLPLALVVITPILANIVAFHLFLDPNPQSFALVGVMVACHVYLTVRHWHVYQPVLVARPPKKEAARQPASAAHTSGQTS